MISTFGCIFTGLITQEAMSENLNETLGNFLGGTNSSVEGGFRFRL